MKRLPAVTGGIASIQPRDSTGCRFEKRLVCRGVFGRGVDPVRQQREMQIAFGRSQIVNLEPLDLLFDCLGRRQERGDGHERPQLRWHALTQRQAGQNGRADSAGDRAIGECDRGVYCRNDTEERKPRKCPDTDLL